MQQSLRSIKLTVICIKTAPLHCVHRGGQKESCVRISLVAGLSRVPNIHDAQESAHIVDGKWLIDVEVVLR
jgi:hypothetical protein